MSIILELRPEIEQELHAQAAARGVSLNDFLREVVTRQALSVSESGPASEAKNLAELFENSPFRGLDIDFERDKDYGREIDL
jgi:hypothetical protein